ncbi:MAG: hypothetical protein AN484_07150 [Aphanizomenon flos-aquae WA102]|jgi:hypothetical protein|uniref:Uncharacterized protein n=1 Tax=Aphanizomenon flos-aquae WA102 TaxID=1710896 RepID=A0A1B7X514_APHFL|nr:MAG: hypothetical protein AN484_07150 [Aphanizomenon flos-aquae WA102]
MTFKTFTATQRKQMHTIMNVDHNLTDEDSVVNVCLSLVAQMCAPEVLDGNAVFYVVTDDEGNIKLEMEA